LGAVLIRRTAGVTFVVSMLERVIEERARGNPSNKVEWWPDIRLRSKRMSRNIYFFDGFC